MTGIMNEFQSFNNYNDKSSMNANYDHSVPMSDLVYGEGRNVKQATSTW